MKKVIIIIIILMSIEIGYIMIPIKYSDKIEGVNYSKKEIKNAEIAFMINDGEGYNESSDDKWPDKEKYAFSKYECYDDKDALLSGSLNFNEDTRTATIKTTKTIYCRLYFDKTSDAEALIIATSEKGREGASGTLESGNELQARNEELAAAGVAAEDLDTLRRFVGKYTEVTDNFICFGIDNKDDCLNNLDLYMYRIIGIDTVNHQIKIIKATRVIQDGTDTFRWNHSSVNCDWGNSDIYKGLNNQVIDSDDQYLCRECFIGNPSYSYMEDINWTKLIVEHPTWYYGDSSSTTVREAKNCYKKERTAKLENGDPIGLMYMSDFLLSAPSTTTAEKNIWLFFKKAYNGSYIPDGYYWTMTRIEGVGTYGTRYARGFYVNGTTHAELDERYSVRPVFYLNSSDLKISGNGKVDDPYIIAGIPD